MSASAFDFLCQVVSVEAGEENPAAGRNVAGQGRGFVLTAFSGTLGCSLMLHYLPNEEAFFMAAIRDL